MEEPEGDDLDAFIDVSPDKDWGDDGEGPETDQRVWDWLVNEVHEDWSVEERIEYAKTIGRYDIVDALEGK